MSAIGSILSNDGALKAENSLRTSSNQTNNLENQLSSGKKINSPADNPSGYITAEGFTSQLNGITQALSNANQGVSLLQTAQGAVNQQTSILQQLNSIAVQASNGTQTPAEAQSLQNVVGQLNSQVNTIANQTQFNNISLLDGSFNGVNFQVGANNGQTINLSIGNSQSGAIGLHASQGAASGIYGSAGAKESAFTASGTGAFTAGSFALNGSNGTAKVNVTSATESAASIASAVNKNTSTTNVQAQASTSVEFGTSGSNFSFTLGNGTADASQTNAVHISANSQSSLIGAINDHTATTGVTAKANSAGNVVLTQSSGKNISITNFDSSGASLTGFNGGSSNLAGSSTTPTSGLFQGKVQLQSDKGFNLGANASNIGLQGNTTLHSLSNINVSTTDGAQKAINVIKYALQGLGAEGGKLGAVQQRLQANINNLNTTSQNLSSAKSVVQDANIPKVSQELTQQQVLQQAGVSALKSSSTLAKQYQRLLP